MREWLTGVCECVRVTVSDYRVRESGLKCVGVTDVCESGWRMCESVCERVCVV